jgi:tRNA dimethylallyltransferase
VMDDRPRVLFLGGPTASGKTAASLAVAEAFGAVVLSADAMQVYCGFDVGTAKATPAERAQIRHEGIDVRQATQAFDASDFVALADSLLEEGARVVVAGGTHMYHQAVRRGLVKTPAVDPALRAELEVMEDRHSELAKVDPVLAERLHPNDRVRVVRGVEVYRQSGQRLSDLQQTHARAPDRVYSEGLWLDRVDLRERIIQRLHSMMEAGYLAEVQRLLTQEVPRESKPMRSLGYRHLTEHLVDGLDLQEAIWRTERDTWTLARKQRNWQRTLTYDVVESPIESALEAAGRLWPAA